ncbi:MAG: NAD(+) diphosphatase [Selenomonadaceae bacterium]
MIQDIHPKVFNNKFENKRANNNDIFLAYEKNNILVRENSDHLWYPNFADFSSSDPKLVENAQFLFTIDCTNYFLVNKPNLNTIPGWTYASIQKLRSESKYWRSFAGIVGYQLNQWYTQHKFCSHCGKFMKKSIKERMLYCENCGLQVYPTISPAIIVGIYNGDRLLLTKYANRTNARHALVAGFTEIGESFEQTVRREVMEEVGLKVKNLTFYKSQPWPFSNTLLAGFFAELDGNDKVTLQEDELSLAVWKNRENIIQEDPLQISLTSEMIEAFRTKSVSL